MMARISVGVVTSLLLLSFFSTAAVDAFARPSLVTAFVPSSHVGELHRHANHRASHRLLQRKQQQTTTTTTTFLSSQQQQQDQHQSKEDDNNSVTTTSISASPNSNSNSNNSNKHSIRFLGRGVDAIVRPGCVLVAPVHEGSHFLMRAALLVVDVGVDDESSNKDENSDDEDEYIIRAVILDHPTPFTMGEMAPHIFEMAKEEEDAVNDNNNNNDTINHVLSEQLIFRGGDAGGDSVLLIHSVADIATRSSSCHAIGTSSSGLYQGGLQEALQSCRTREDALQYKFFFNYCQFTEMELEKMLATSVDSQGDAWVSVEVSPSFVLQNDLERGDAWAFLRNSIQQGGY